MPLRWHKVERWNIAAGWVGYTCCESSLISDVLTGLMIIKILDFASERARSGPSIASLLNSVGGAVE